MAKHPVPKQKTPKSRTSRRHKSFVNKARIRLSDALQLTKCGTCGAMTPAHHACAECGFYRGKDILGKSAKAEATSTTIKAE